MSRIFDVVQSLSGQRNSVVIPRQFLQFFSGDQQAYQLAAVLNQLVFWSGYSTREDGWFYKTHEELGDEVALSSDQVRRIVDKLTRTYFPDVLRSRNKRTASGDKVKHYFLDGDALIDKLFPATPVPEKTEQAEGEKATDSPDGNGEVAEPETQNRHSGMAEPPLHGNGEVAVPVLYTDLNTDPDIQILNYRPAKNSEATRRFLQRHPDAAEGVYSPGGKSWGNADDVTASVYIYRRVLKVNATLQTPNWIEWANDIRLLRNSRNIQHKQICEVFQWANKHHFWCTNILSPSGLRRKWDNLVAQMSQRPPAGDGLDWDNTDWAEGVLS